MAVSCTGTSRCSTTAATTGAGGREAALAACGPSFFPQPGRVPTVSRRASTLIHWKRGSLLRSIILCAPTLHADAARSGAKRGASVFYFLLRILPHHYAHWTALSSESH